MSTFDSLESSVESSRPVELYRFAIGLEELRYTNADGDVTYDGDTYRSEAIGRGPIAVAPGDRGRPVDVRVPAVNEFAVRFNLIVPGENATLTITRYQPEAASAQTSLIFKGFVSHVVFNEGEAKLVVKPIDAVVSRTIGRDKCSALCNHVVYGDGCDVDPDPHKVFGVCTAVNGSVITVAGAESMPDGHWLAGLVTPSGLGESRMVFAHSGQDLTLLVPFVVDVVGETIELLPGCDHLVDGHCSTRFDNVEKHGGFPFPPNENPFRPSGVF